MNKVLKLGTQELEVRASALTPILYTSFYNKDYYKEYNNAVTENAGIFLGEVTYIMHIQATAPNPQEALKKAKIEDYYTFLDTYPPMEFVDKMADIIAVMLDIQKNNSTSKKKQSKPTEK